MLSGEPLDPGPLARQGGVERERCVALQVDAAVRASSASLRARYRDRGLVISGVPCDQFAGQEPGKPEEIAEFYSTSYSVMFPRTEKLKVSGQARHPLYELLTALPDRSGIVGDAQWNFEKFIVSPRGKPSRGFRPTTLPEAAELDEAIEENLPGSASPEWSAKAACEVAWAIGDRPPRWLAPASPRECGGAGAARTVTGLRGSQPGTLAQGSVLTREEIEGRRVSAAPLRVRLLPLLRRATLRCVRTPAPPRLLETAGSSPGCRAVPRRAKRRARHGSR